MWHFKKTLRADSFTFAAYEVDSAHSTVSFTYRVKFKSGRMKTYTDRLFFKDIAPELWDRVPKSVLEPALRALLLMLGINYWCVFPTRDINIEGFKLTPEEARFWDSLYLNGLGEFFYLNKIDFRDLIAFPFDPTAPAPEPSRLKLSERALILNGAGKDSILTAEMLKAAGKPFDFFAFSPSPAHGRIANLVGAKTVTVNRRRDWRLPWLSLTLGLSNTYPSVSTFTFIAVLLAQLRGYDSIVFSNERSADFGNLTYLGLPINHQWCKSTEAEKMISNYIQRFITPNISTISPLRKFSELEIVKNFAQYPKYLHEFTSCNTYFWLPRIQQNLQRTNYWCNECPKCVFLFTCFSAFLPKKEVTGIFHANLYSKKRLLPLIKRLLGLEGFKPLDCVGEPEEMILAMHYAGRKGEYSEEPAMKLFEKLFPPTYNFGVLELKIFNNRKANENK